MIRKLTFLSLFCLLTLLPLGKEALSKSWRGITPLRSTRADVVRQFGKCSDREEYCGFEIGNEDVSIEFLDDMPRQEYKCDKSLPANAVLLIRVEPIKPLRFSSLKINKRTLKSFDLAYPDYKAYINNDQGVIISVYKGEVLKVGYFASARDVSFCPTYYEDPESFVRTFSCSLPPTVSLVCPSTEPKDGDRIELVANAPVEDNFLFTWMVTNGKIIEGQGTRRIVVDATGVGGSMITATVEMNDGNQHTASSSCTIKVVAKPQ
jgi:hypothetical protein